MAVDDNTRAARLAQIERSLAREEPELAEALRRWRPPRPPRRVSTRILVVGLVCACVALLFGSTAWCILTVIVAGSGWCIARGLEGEARRRT